MTNGSAKAQSCTHHWTTTSECPLCLRAQLDALLTRLREPHVLRAVFPFAPCIFCGYSGPGYYNASAHTCAERYQATSPWLGGAR